MNRFAVAALLLPAVLAACACTVNGRGTAQPITFDGGHVTIDGCLSSPDEDGKLRLRIVGRSDADGDQRGNIGPVGTPLSQSTSIDGPWIGTRQLELIPNGSMNLAQYYGRVVRVTGALEPAAGTTGLTDQMKAADGVRFVSVRVESLQPTERQCASAANGGAREQT
jgi:hypothetical protein